jgi:hypothetical protein
MPASRRALTAAQVAAIKADGVTWVAPSLYVQVREQGTRSFLFRYSRSGGNVWMGLGSLAEKPFTEARDEAAMLRALVKRGGDPLAEKRNVEAKLAAEQKPPAPTFGAALQDAVVLDEPPPDCLVLRG